MKYVRAILDIISSKHEKYSSKEYTKQHLKGRLQGNYIHRIRSILLPNILCRKSRERGETPVIKLSPQL